MTNHSSIPARRTPWTGRPGGLQSQGHRGSDATEPIETHEHADAPGGPAVKTQLPLHGAWAPSLVGKYNLGSRWAWP